MRLATFTLLALYGVAGWGSLMRPSPTGRLLAMMGMGAALAAAGPALRAVRIAPRLPRIWLGRIIIVLLALVTTALVLALAGVPWTWIRHLRLAVITRGVGEGLASLPGLLLPYLGINPWTRMVILLGAGVLLLVAGLLAGFGPARTVDRRRAGAAAALLALAVIPRTLVAPHHRYLQGLVLLILLIAFLHADRVSGRQAPSALALAAVGATVAVVVAPRLDVHRPWIDYNALAERLAPKHIERFDWSQGYGPLAWPRTGTEVLEVKASAADYWKTEGLDLFDGRQWVQGLQSGEDRVPAPAPDSLKRWTQTIQVTLSAMRSPQVVAAGAALAPANLPQGAQPGPSAGTWTTLNSLGPGDSYRISTYSPRPSAGQLSTDHGSYGATGMAGYRSILLPAVAGNNPQTVVTFPLFHSNVAVQTVPDVGEGSIAVEGSPYGKTYGLARRLAAGAPTPYAFVQAVIGYLGHGFTYSETPPVRPYPLASFLFVDRAGYCQQFAGAAALLLRMGGLPSRVATGFTSGTYDRATHSFRVTDTDAHSWVEVWFPRYGWVRFDPTPAAAPARGGGARATLSKVRGAGPSRSVGLGHRQQGTASFLNAGARTRRGSGGSGVWALVVFGAALAGLGWWWWAPPRGVGAEKMLAELERALARSGRRLPEGMTLDRLEQRFGVGTPAAAYVRAVKLARYAGTAAGPSAAQRRGLRAQLASGLGIGGFLRAVWALPPRRS